MGPGLSQGVHMARASSRSIVLAVAAAAMALALIGTASYAAIVITGKQIKDKTLGPNDLLVRVASAQVDDDAVTNTTAPTTALKVKIVAPTKGYLITTASSDVFDYGTASSSGCDIQVGDKYAKGSFRSISSDPTVNPEEDCVTNVTIPVAAGQYTVKFMAFPGETTTTFDETALQVEFVPFNGVGKQPTAKEIKRALEPVTVLKSPSNR
jgi:hypothetical protein